MNTHNLARRMATKQTADARTRIATDADRLTTLTQQFAADIRTGGTAGGAWQIAQAAIDLLRQSARLDGMTDIAALLPDTPEDIL
ncbi:MAG: hypothetical protein HOW97_08140 [Catenulispora sp.]|nr:hypothetical protein [Catenulispora sp.]